MPIFSANSTYRRVLFRTAVVLTVGVCFLVVCSFFFEFFFRPFNVPITLSQAHDTYLYYHSPLHNKKVALTFDDGPTAEETNAIMDILEEYEAPATFFFLGVNSMIYPHIVSDTARRGFEVGNHTFTHSYEVHTSAKRLEKEIKATHILLTHLTGTEPRYYRPPFLLDIGTDPAPNPYLPTEEAELWTLSLGYLPVGIDLDSSDWEMTTAEGVVATIKEGLESEEPGGRIALFHEYSRTAEAVEEVIISLRAEGYTLVPLSELLEPPTSIALTHALEFGDTDAQTEGEVSILQWFLYKQGLLDPYTFTGVFDDNTAFALEQFQAREGLSAENTSEFGVAGPLTRERIAALSAEEHVIAEGTSMPSVLREARSWVEVQFLYLVGNGRETVGFIFHMALGLMVLRLIAQISLLTYGRMRRAREAQVTSLPYTGGVSVIIPAYNEEENIRSTVESIIACTYKRREIIVIDDGSKDSTAAVVQGVMSDFPYEHISLIQIENGGKANALNIGVEAAQHGIVVVLDADAVLEPQAIEHMVKHFSDERVAAVAGKVYTVSWSGFLNKFQALEYMVGQNIDKRAAAAASAVGVVPGPAGAWRRDLILAAGGFPADTLVEDQDMTLTLLRMGYHIEYEPKAIAYTETPENVNNFLKQRFRWIYGMLQCFWKHKGAALEKPFSRMTLLVLPNMLLFGIIVPLTFPIADTVLIFSLLSGSWSNLLIPIILYSAVDMAYAAWGVAYERRGFSLLWFVPLQRFAYRELIYYTVIRSIVHAIEGRTSGWNKFKKKGETARFYVTATSASTTPVSN